jgi:hypothetical protein
VVKFLFDRELIYLSGVYYSFTENKKKTRIIKNLFPQLRPSLCSHKWTTKGPLSESGKLKPIKSDTCDSVFLLHIGRT